MKHWVLHFENDSGHEVYREYPQPFFPKWKDVVDMIHREIQKQNPFFKEYRFNGKSALLDLNAEKQKLANAIGQLIYGNS